MALAGTVLLLGVSVPVSAQSGPGDPSNGSGTTADAVDVDRLPVNLARIRRELKQAPAGSETRDGLNLRYFLQIYGSAPQLVLFTPADDLVRGAVPFAAPSHREIIRVITPKEFSVPVISTSVPKKKR
jgi:hypothetical protein